MNSYVRCWLGEITSFKRPGGIITYRNNRLRALEGEQNKHICRQLNAFCKICFIKNIG